MILSLPIFFCDTLKGPPGPNFLRFSFGFGFNLDFELHADNGDQFPDIPWLNRSDNERDVNCRNKFYPPCRGFLVCMNNGVTLYLHHICEYTKPFPYLQAKQSSDSDWGWGQWLGLIAVWHPVLFCTFDQLKIWHPVFVLSLLLIFRAPGKLTGKLARQRDT